MAEFDEVMRQWVRCRKATAAKRDNQWCLSFVVIDELDDKYITKIEYDVMKWAEEHPEAIYETWYEYLSRVGVIPGNVPNGEAYQWIVESLKHKHISSDTAEKLGLKPREE